MTAARSQHGYRTLIRRWLGWPFRVWAVIREALVEPGHRVQRTLQSYRHGFSLSSVQDNTHGIRPGDVLLFATLRNEAVRIPFFLDYYRGLGVNHFLFVDNDSTDGFQALVAGMDDVSVWHTDASYRDANFGMHWLNRLLRAHGCGHWCVTCDPDEFLVFPHAPDRNLAELGGFLESEQRRSLCCVMLDMYSERPIDEAVYRSGDDPFDVAPWFDGNGYVQGEGWLREIKVAGGVRRRVFFRDAPDQAPSIHKTPFVKWHWSYSYFLSMHQLLPSWLNLPHAERHLSPTGCVMHFKYFSLLFDKVAEEMERRQHWAGSYEYRKYHEHLESEAAGLCYEKSIRFEDWRQLVRLGFMNTGQWF